MTSKRRRGKGAEAAPMKNWTSTHLHSHHLLVGFVSKSGPRLFTLYLISPQLYVDPVCPYTQITLNKIVRDSSSLGLQWFGQKTPWC